jgi:protoporphyrinogen oxidase
VPDCWIYVQEPDVKIGRLQVFNNWSPYMVEEPASTVWIGLEYFCNEGDDMWTMSYKDFIDFAINELCAINVIAKEDVLKATRVKVKKAYPAYFGSYEHFDSVKEYLNKFDNLFCIGRNGQHRYNNMDHSMLTAIAAVNCIKAGTVDKSSVWNVNTEEEYHEK